MKQRTFGIIKPDAVSSGLVGNIKTMIESAGLNIVREVKMTVSIETIKQHYSKSDEWCTKVGRNVSMIFHNNGKSVLYELKTDDPTAVGRIVHGWVIKEMISGDLIIMEIEGDNAVDVYRDLCGATYPDQAEPWTIRGALSNDNNTKAVLEHRAIRNLVHSSENADEAAEELAFWFSEEILLG